MKVIYIFGSKKVGRFFTGLFERMSASFGKDFLLEIKDCAWKKMEREGIYYWKRLQGHFFSHSDPIHFTGRTFLLHTSNVYKFSRVFERRVKGLNEWSTIVLNAAATKKSFRFAFFTYTLCPIRFIRSQWQTSCGEKKSVSSQFVRSFRRFGVNK